MLKQADTSIQPVLGLIRQVTAILKHTNPGLKQVNLQLEAMHVLADYVPRGSRIVADSKAELAEV